MDGVEAQGCPRDTWMPRSSCSVTQDTGRRSGLGRRSTLQKNELTRVNCCHVRTYTTCVLLAPVAARIPRPSRMYVTPTHNKTSQEVLETTSYKVLRGHTASKSLHIKDLPVACSVSTYHVVPAQADTPHLMDAAL